MDPTVVDQHAIESLSDKDKIELRQFITNEQQRSKLRQQTHGLTDTCWKKCVTGQIKSNTLSGSEESCMANCVDRFLDVNMAVVKHLSQMRQ